MRACADVASVPSVMRRPSQGAQHAGRGGAGNVFKEGEKEELQKKTGDSAVDDSNDSGSSIVNDKEKEGDVKDEGFVAKLKNGLFGKKLQ